MSEDKPKRKPFLSEQEARDYIESWNGSIDQWDLCSERTMAQFVIDHYERMIDEGKLLIAE